MIQSSLNHESPFLSSGFSELNSYLSFSFYPFIIIAYFQSTNAYYIRGNLSQPTITSTIENKLPKKSMKFCNDKFTFTIMSHSQIIMEQMKDIMACMIILNYSNFRSSLIWLWRLKCNELTKWEEAALLWILLQSWNLMKVRIKFLMLCFVM